MTNFQSTFDLDNKKTLQVGCQNTEPGNYYLNNNSNYTLLMHILNTKMLLFSPFNPFLYSREYFLRRRWWNLMSELPKLLCIASQPAVLHRTMFENIIGYFKRILFLLQWLWILNNWKRNSFAMVLRYKICSKIVIKWYYPFIIIYIPISMTYVILL